MAYFSGICLPDLCPCPWSLVRLLILICLRCRGRTWSVKLVECCYYVSWGAAVVEHSAGAVGRIAIAAAAANDTPSLVLVGSETEFARPRSSLRRARASRRRVHQTWMARAHAIFDLHPLQTSSLSHPSCCCYLKVSSFGASWVLVR